MAVQPKLVLLDVNSLIYRAFYALQSLVTSSGEPTNAVYGLVLMLLKLYDEERPDFMAACFDLPFPTFRHKKFAPYKAQRPKMPESLVSQLPLVRETLSAFGIPIFEKEGYEADDLIGTLAKLGERENFGVSIVSSDLDMLQLVNSQIEVLVTLKGVTKTVTYGREEVKKRYEIEPEQLIDLKALKGDASDNIPGVPGFGEKTSSALIKKFGSLEELFRRIEELPPLQKELLLTHQEQARLSKELVTIDTSVPLKVDLSDCKVRREKKKIKSWLEKLEFKRLLKRVEQIEEESSQLALGLG